MAAPIEECVVTIGSLKAAADLRTKQFYFVKVTAAFAANICGTLGERAIGVLGNAPNTNEMCEIQIGGIVKVTASAAISAAALVTTAASGKAVTAASGHHVHGIALEAAGADEDRISVLLGYQGVV